MCFRNRGPFSEKKENLKRSHIPNRKEMYHRGDQIFFSATCPGQVASKNPLVLRNFLLVPKYFSHCISFGQVVNTTISYSKCNSNQTVVDKGSSDIIFRLLFSVTIENITY